MSRVSEIPVASSSQLNSANIMSETIACPKCGQQTAPQFFRKVGRQQLCVLCAQRTEQAEKSIKETIEDRKLHGGYGWLWKHIALVIVCFFAYLVFRGFIGGLLRSLFGAN